MHAGDRRAQLQFVARTNYQADEEHLHRAFQDRPEPSRLCTSDPLRHLRRADVDLIPERHAPTLRNLDKRSPVIFAHASATEGIQQQSSPSDTVKGLMPIATGEPRSRLAMRLERPANPSETGIVLFFMVRFALTAMDAENLDRTNPRPPRATSFVRHPSIFPSTYLLPRSCLQRSGTTYAQTFGVPFFDSEYPAPDSPCWRA